MTASFRHRASVWAGHVSRHVTIGDRDPQQQVRVTLDGLGAPLDVTRNHVVAGLKPLTLALVLPPGVPPATISRGELRLTFSPRSDPDTVLGEIGLKHDGTVTAERATFQLFRCSHHADRCMPWFAAAVFGVGQSWGEWKRRRQPGFRMDAPDLAAFLVLYICPRPVVLVTVQHGPANNLFPMDLIGPTDSPYFLMSLRTSTPSVGLITESRRMALADVPLEYTGAAYQMGQHHRKERIDWSSLPFDTEPSPVHGLPVLRAALRFRDVVVRDVRVVGSHTLFITEVVHELRRNDGLQLFHVSGPYYRYLLRRGTAPPLPG